MKAELLKPGAYIPHRVIRVSGHIALYRTSAMQIEM